MVKFLLPLVLLGSFCYPLFGIEDRYQEQASISPEVIADMGGIEAIQAELRNLALSQGAIDGFPQEVSKEVDKLVKKGLNFTGLKDMTNLAFITIDNDHSKDLDQAMNIEKLADGYRVNYAIADAAFFVKLGSKLDAWASKRVFTTYLPGFDMPVLPRILSEDLCSLKAEKNRRALVVSFTVTPEGKTKDLSFSHAFIKSRRQLSYRLVQGYYDEPQNSDYGAHDYSATLDNLKEVGEILLVSADQRGVVDGFDSELRVRIDGENILVGNYMRHRVERYNEQVSVMTNSLVAKFIESRGLRSIHRYHQEPTPAMEQDLRQRLSLLGLLWSPNEKLNNFVAGLDFATSLGQAANMQVSRVNFRAVYTDLHAGHSGLKLRQYDHFTAPMRRYPDIVVARILLSIMEGVKGNGFEEIKGRDRHAIVEKIEEAANREQKIEQKIERYISSLLLLDKVDQTLEAQIVYVNKHGASLRISGNPVEIWLKMAELEPFGGPFELSSNRMSLVSDSATLSVLDPITFHVSKKDNVSLVEFSP